MRRATGALLALGLLVGGAAASASQSAIPQGFSVAARSDLAPGVEYSKLTKGSPAIVAHVAHILPGAPVDLAVVNANDKLSTGPTELETTSSMCGREHCVVGVNGDFHDNGVPVGGIVAGGRMLQSPDPARPQLSLTKDGHLVAGAFPWSGALTFADGGQVALGAVNTAPPANGLALYTPDYGGATPASGRTELVVGLGGPAGALNSTVPVDLRGLRSGAGPIPADGAVLSADGAAAQQLAAAWARKQNGGLAPRARMTLSSPIAAAASLGAYPIVLHDGKKAMPYGNDPNLIYPQQPHTLVAWNPAGDVYLVAVDGRQASSVGVTMDQAADFLLGLGATEAVNLDGGGGTTMVEGATVVNRPSDPDPANPGGYFQRGATNALVVIARPGATTTTSPGSVKPMSTPPPTTAAGGGPGTTTTSGPSDTPSTVPDGGVPFGSLSGAVGQGNPDDLPIGPSPADVTAAPAGAIRGSPKLQPQAATAGSGEVSMPASPPDAKPDKGSGSETHTVTDALRAPLSVASSVSSGLVDAIGRDSSGPASHARRVVTLFAAALAVTAVTTRRRRRSGDRPGGGPTAALLVPATVPLAVMPPLKPVVVEPVVVEPVAVERVAPKSVMFREVPSDNELRLLVRGLDVSRL